jgi:hypothetical protein
VIWLHVDSPTANKLDPATHTVLDDVRHAEEAMSYRDSAVRPLRLSVVRKNLNQLLAVISARYMRMFVRSRGQYLPLDRTPPDLLLEVEVSTEEKRGLKKVSKSRPVPLSAFCLHLTTTGVLIVLTDQ